MGTLLALAGFIFVVSVTPGPNTVLLWASGAAFGFRATLRHVLGTALGVGSMALLASAGLGALLTAAPQVGLAMKLGASAYLLRFSYQVAAARALQRGASAHPLGLFQAAAFQAVNPKAWILALGTVTTFRPAEFAPLTGSVLVAACMAAVVIPTQALWAGAGGSLGRVMTDDRTRRRVSFALAVLLAASVIDVWARGTKAISRDAQQLAGGHRRRYEPSSRVGTSHSHQRGLLHGHEATGQGATRMR